MHPADREGELNRDTSISSQAFSPPTTALPPLDCLFRSYTRPPLALAPLFLAAETTSLPPTTFLSLSLLTFLRLYATRCGAWLFLAAPIVHALRDPSGRVLLAICRSLRWRYSLKGDGFRPAVTDAIIGWKLCIIVPGLLLIPHAVPVSVSSIQQQQQEPAARVQAGSATCGSAQLFQYFFRERRRKGRKAQPDGWIVCNRL